MEEPIKNSVTFADTKPIFMGAENQPMMAARHIKAKKQAILSAWIGFLLVLLISIPFIQFNVITLHWGDWFLFFIVNFSMWSGFWLMVHFGFDRYFTFDPHFLLIPALGASLLICFLVYTAPHIRVLILGGWFTVLLFGSGLLGFREAMSLSLFMAVSYLCTIYLLVHHGEPISISHELWLILPSIVFWTFCATVLERDKRNRNENRHLRLQLSEMAFADSLTGLLNRRAFNTVLEQETSYSERSGHACVLAMVDIDYFKRVNDQLGHKTGDNVLIEVAHIIRACIRKEDIAARFGGDEFVLLIREQYIEKAQVLFERIRQNVEVQMQDLENQEGFKVTLSIGVAAWQPGQALTDILQQADAALYEAKRLGRNRVYCQPHDLALTAA